MSSRGLRGGTKLALLLLAGALVVTAAVVDPAGSVNAVGKAAAAAGRGIAAFAEWCTEVVDAIADFFN